MLVYTHRIVSEIANGLEFEQNGFAKRNIFRELGSSKPLRITHASNSNAGRQFLNSDHTKLLVQSAWVHVSHTIIPNPGPFWTTLN